MSSRLTLLPDPYFLAQSSALQERLNSVAASITAENFGSMLDEAMRKTIREAFSRANASEGTIWLVDEHANALVAAFNTGPNAARLVGLFSHPLESGVISMVFASEQSFVENEVYKNARQDKSLDSLLRLQTYAMIATPFYFLEACRGVISCVQLNNPFSGEFYSRGFDEADKAVVHDATVTLGGLLDLKVLRATVGLG